MLRYLEAKRRFTDPILSHHHHHLTDAFKVTLFGLETINLFGTHMYIRTHYRRAAPEDYGGYEDMYVVCLIPFARSESVLF